MLKAVLIDSREPVNVQQMSFDAPTAVTSLSAGDLWAATETDHIIIERKSASDLLNSIADNRLLNQASEMRKLSSWCYLVVCEPLTPTADGYVKFAARDSRWSWKSVQGALLTVQEMGVGVVILDGIDDYPAAIKRLANRKRELIIAPRIKERVLTPGENILAALPGIGFEKAQAVAEEFDGNVAEALSWLTWRKAVFSIPGIGEITKDKIRKALGMSDEQELYCLMEEDRCTTRDTKTLPENQRESASTTGVAIATSP